MVTISEVMELARKLGLLVDSSKYKDRLTGLQVESFKFFHVSDDGDYWKFATLVSHLKYQEDTSRQDYLDKLGKAYNDLKQFERWN